MHIPITLGAITRIEVVGFKIRTISSSEQPETYEPESQAARVCRSVGT